MDVKTFREIIEDDVSAMLQDLDQFGDMTADDRADTKTILEAGIIAKEAEAAAAGDTATLLAIESAKAGATAGLRYFALVTLVFASVAHADGRSESTFLEAWGHTIDNPAFVREHVEQIKTVGLWPWQGNRGGHHESDPAP